MRSPDFLTSSPVSKALRRAAVGGGEARCPAALLQEAADEIDALRDALHWCGGSPSFREGGEAEEGWRRIVEPLFGSDLVTSRPADPTMPAVGGAP